jgi:predicted O-linked N-acetylglucosamine transferase (SPINDLY family)
MSPLSAGAFTDDPILQLAMAWHYNKSDVAEPAAPIATFKPVPTTNRPLRVGYLSSDLREHAVGYLMAEVFALHDRSKVEVFAYYCGPAAKDPLHHNFKSTADHWTSITGLDDLAAAKKIAADNLDILVDLNGYTREARINVVALRPAPILVNWLGYPGTMGSPYHHYIIADDWIIPEENELYYSEKVRRLPCYQPNNRKRPVAKRPSRAEAGLPENAFVYCCFNGAHKINRFTYDRWLLILARVPNSVLWLLSNTETTDKRLRDYAAKQGIAPERIIFAQKLANPFHLARYPLADLFLDTAPYGAHTTGSDALWMGVPVLTLNGKSFAARVCGSLVRSANIPEMICETAEDYVQRAVDFGTDPSQLKPIADKLRAERDTCPLFDTPALVKHLEELYAQMRDDFDSGNLPRPDLTNLDVYLDVGSRVNHDEIEVQTLNNYHDWWRQNLAQRHALRPIPNDNRLMTQP